MAKDTGIRFRVYDPEEWKEFDDKRHALRESWQSLGMSLFRKWLKEGQSARDVPAIEPPAPELSEEEAQWAFAAVHQLRHGKENEVEMLRLMLREHFGKPIEEPQAKRGRKRA